MGKDRSHEAALEGRMKVEYQNNASDFFGGYSMTREGRRRVAHGFSILRWAEGAVRLRDPDLLEIG